MPRKTPDDPNTTMAASASVSVNLPQVNEIAGMLGFDLRRADPDSNHLALAVAWLEKFGAPHPAPDVIDTPVGALESLRFERGGRRLEVTALLVAYTPSVVLQQLRRQMLAPGDPNRWEAYTPPDVAPKVEGERVLRVVAWMIRHGAPPPERVTEQLGSIDTQGNPISYTNDLLVWRRGDTEHRLSTELVVNDPVIALMDLRVLGIAQGSPHEILQYGPGHGDRDAVLGEEIPGYDPPRYLSGQYDTYGVGTLYTPTGSTTTYVKRGRRDQNSPEYWVEMRPGT